MNTLSIKRIVCTCCAGGSLYEAFREAAILALQQDQEVEFVHNEQHYFIKPQEIIKQFEKNI